MNIRKQTEWEPRQRLQAIASLFACAVRRHRQDRLDAAISAELMANRVDVADEIGLSVSRTEDLTRQD